MGIVQLCSPKAISDIWLKSFSLWGNGVEAGLLKILENYLPTMYGIPSRSSYRFPSRGS